MNKYTSNGISGVVNSPGKYSVGLLRKEDIIQ